SKGGGIKPGQGFLIDLAAAIKDNNSGHEKAGPRQLKDGVGGELAEKAGVKGQREHHHIYSEKSRYDQTDQIGSL
ncbi:hypothetical protein ACFL0M_11760, partial [Thermodesulfobacteriota bacterium]